MHRDEATGPSLSRCKAEKRKSARRFGLWGARQSGRAAACPPFDGLGGPAGCCGARILRGLSIGFALALVRGGRSPDCGAGRAGTWGQSRDRKKEEKQRWQSFAVPRATFELSVRLATLPLVIGAKMLGARNDDEPGEEPPARSTPSGGRSSASTRSRSQKSPRKRDSGQTKRRSTRSTSSAAARRPRRRSVRRRATASARASAAAAEVLPAQDPAPEQRRVVRAPGQAAASPGRADFPVATPKSARRSDAAVVAAHVQARSAHLVADAAAPEPPTPTDAAIAAALRGTAEVQEGAEAAAQAATQDSSGTETADAQVRERAGGRRPEPPL